MKKFLILLCALFLFITAACSRQQPDDLSNSEASSEFLESALSSAPVENIESTTQSEPETSVGESSKENSVISEKNTTESTGSKPVDGSSKSPNPPANNSTPQASSTSPPTNQSSSVVVLPKDASPSDAGAIANKIIEYINQYRVEQGAGAVTKLPGLTQVAEYRSKQLVTNYAHDINATHEATRYYQYGEHIVYGELDYYAHWAREAIGRSGGNNPVDDVARIMATGFKNSSGHWAYVGAAEYKYIAVGATYGNNQWYICILVSETGTYG